MAGLRDIPDDAMLETLYLRLRKSKIMELDIAHYDRMPRGSPPPEIMSGY